MVEGEQLGLGVVVVVGEEFGELAKGSKSAKAVQAGFICSPQGTDGLTVARSVVAEPVRPAGRPPETSRSRSPVASRSLRGVTTSRSSPVRSDVRASGTMISPSRITSETEAPRGSRSSPTSTPCICERGLIVTWSRSAATLSSGAASTSSPRGSERRATRSTRAASGRVGPVSSV